MYGCKTEVLKSIRGYDEDFSMCGKEDKDMYGRLKDMGMKFYSEKTLNAHHLWHDRGDKTEKGAKDMNAIFANKSPSDHIRNHEAWGEG